MFRAASNYLFSSVSQTLFYDYLVLRYFILQLVTINLMSRCRQPYIKAPHRIRLWYRAQGLLRIPGCSFPISASLLCAYMSQESAQCVALSWIHVWWKRFGRRGLVKAWAPVTTSSLLPLFVQSTSYYRALYQLHWESFPFWRYMLQNVIIQEIV